MVPKGKGWAIWHTNRRMAVHWEETQMLGKQGWLDPVIIQECVVSWQMWVCML